MSYPYHRLIKPRLGTPIYKGHRLAKGLVGCWLMNEGGGNKIYDLSGKNNTGSFVGDTQWVAGKFGPATKFDGVDDGIDFGGTSGVNFGTSNSLSVFLKVTDVFLNNIIVGHITYLNGGYFLNIGNTTTLYYSASGTYVSVTVPTLSLNTWYHFGVTRSGLSVKFYVNGNQVGSTQTLVANFNLICSMINGYRTPATAFNWAGLINNVMIFNRALTANEVAQLYREPFRMFERERIELWSKMAGLRVPVAIHHYQMAGGL